MNRFSRISHHVSVKEVKQKRLEKLAEKKLEEKKIEEEKNFLISAMNHARYDWRQKIDRNYIMREGMTTGNMTTTSVPAAEGDGEVSSLNAIDGSSYTAIDSFFAKDDNLPANLGTQIRASGAGTGQDGGFNVSGNYLAFQGTGTADSANSRFAVLSPIDSTKIDTLQIKAIVGNDFNGGEDPDANGEQLMVMYKTPAMSQPKFIIQRPDGSIPSDITGTEDQIIPIGAAPNAGLNDYSISIPDYARAEGTQFILIQPFNSGVGFDNYGVTEIKFKRKAPVTVFVPLDDPEAISFINVGTNEGDPKKRKKKVNDQLAASDEYTSTLLGDRFPGQGGRISEEDPFKSAEIQDVTEPSPIGKPAVTKSFTDFQKGPNTVEVKKTPEQIKAQNDEYIADIEETLKNNNYDFTDPKIIEIADKILETDPKNFDAYSYKIGTQYETGDIEGALKSTDAMIKNNPDDATGYELRSFIKKGEGDLAGAIEDLEKAIELDPDSEYIAYSEMELADLKFQQAELESDAAEKERLESEAGAIEGKAHKDYWNNPTDLLPQNNISEEQQQQINSNLAQAKDLMTTTHYGIGRDGAFSKGAVDLLQEILPLDPNNTEVLSNLGVAMIMDRYSSTTKGIEYLEKAQALDPSIKIDFGIKSWDRYDGEEEQPYAGAKINRLSNLPHRYAREVIKNLPDQSTATGAKYGAVENYTSRSQEYTDKAKGYTTRNLQRRLVSVARRIEDNKYWMSRAYDNSFGDGRDTISMSAVFGFMQVGMKGAFTGAVPPDVTQKLKDAREGLDKKTQDAYRTMRNPANYIPKPNAAYNKAYAFTNEGGWKQSAEYQYEENHKHIPAARSAALRLNSMVKGDVEEYQALYKEYMSREVGELPEAPVEETPTLYGWMKDTYETEEINQAIQELGFDEQYKDLMAAWDSAEKFSKFLTPLANLSKAFGDTLGKVGKALDDNVTAGANNAQLENYKIAIAKSVLLNRPIRVDPTTISTTLKQKLAMGINPNMISTFDVENPAYDSLKEFKQDGVMKYDYIQENPDYEGDGVGVIPIVREPKPYADFNIYTDEAGNVYKQERSATGEPTVPNTTFQTDKSFKSGFMKGALASITRQNPLASRGQAQYQIVVPPDGSEPYLLYEDHAYYNIDSQDPTAEAPGLSDAAAKFVNWLGNTAYKRNDGDANTGGMAGYPPNIRGDVITKFRINASDLPRRVREAIYRHPFLSENPGIAQAIEDKLYNEREIKTILGSKGLHNYYMNRQRLANTFRDFAVDKSIELIMGLPSIEGTKNDLRSASNLLQRYDDYIQSTVFQPDGKTYIPGIVDADENVQSRIDVTDEFVKVDQDHLKSMFNDDEDVQKILRAYVKGNTSKTSVSNVLQARIGDIMNASNPAYRKVLANSLGKGTRVNVDEFLNGKIVLEKNFEFRDETVNSNWVLETVANMFDVSTDTAAAGGFFTSLATMTAARHLLNPVRGPGILPGMKQTFRQAMNSAPTMPYKLEFDLSEKMMKILQGIEDKSREEEDLGVSATDAATLAAEKRRKKKNIKEQTLFERVKPKPFFNPKDIKPTFPEKPPGKIDPKTGMHSEYGKRARRFKKLDPMSANAMPVQGDPELDAVVNQQRTKEIPSKRREKYIKKVAEQKKYSWRQDFIKESEWSPVTGAGPTNATSQTFGYFDGGGNPIVNSQTGQQVTTTASGLGGVEATSSTTTIDLGFGETLNVSSPTYDQLALAGIAKPIVMKRKETDDTNKKLDASQKFAKKVGADVMMNARVKTGELSLEQKKEFVEIYKKNMEEYDKKSAERSREIEKRINANISKVNKFLSKYGQKLQSSYPMGNSDIRIINGGRKLVVISHNGFNYSDTEKFNVRVFEAMPGKTISKKTGNFGKVSGKGFLGNVYSKGSGSGQATIMYTNIGSQIEGKNFNIIGVPNVTMPTPPKFMQKNMSKGWQPSATSSYDKEFINKMNAWFNTIPTGGANFPAQLAINLAKGNLDPVTKSPGPVITNLIKQNILDNLKQGFTKSDKLGTISYWDPKSGKGAIRYDMYKGFTAKMAPVSAALGRYSIERTDKGIRIADTYDISGGFTSPGGAAIFDPLTKLIGGKDVQLTGETLTAIAARRAAELGYDMVDADTGKTLQPVYSGEEEFNSRTYPNSGAPTIATPKGFNIKIDFTIPWSSFPPETVNQLKIGSKQIVNPLSTTKKPSKAVQTIKKMAKTKSIGFDRDEPIVRRRKKKK